MDFASSNLFFYNSRTIYIQFANKALKNRLYLFKIITGGFRNTCHNRNDGFCMKNNKKDSKMVGFKKAVAAAAKMATAANVNSACFFVAHQPKLPKGAEKLRKF